MVTAPCIVLYLEHESCVGAELDFGDVPDLTVEIGDVVNDGHLSAEIGSSSQDRRGICIFGMVRGEDH